MVKLIQNNHKKALFSVKSHKMAAAVKPVFSVYHLRSNYQSDKK